MKRYTSVDAHIKSQPPKVRALLTQLRKTIKSEAPDATEKIAYGIPTFSLGGHNLIHFAGYEKHIGIYPGSAAIRAYKKELAGYKLAKGTIQLPIDKPLPTTLIRKIVRHCVRTTLERYA